MIIAKEVKKRMERELRQYWENNKKLEQLENKKDTSTRVLLYAAEKIKYVENVIKNLTPSEKEVFYLIFQQGCNWVYCETRHNISKSTYYNVYNKSITLLAEEWGEI